MVEIPKALAALLMASSILVKNIGSTAWNSFCTTAGTSVPRIVSLKIASILLVSLESLAMGSGAAKTRGNVANRGVYARMTRETKGKERSGIVHEAHPLRQKSSDIQHDSKKTRKAQKLFIKLQFQVKIFNMFS